MIHRSKSIVWRWRDWLLAHDRVILLMVFVAAFAVWYLIAATFPYELLPYPGEVFLKAFELYTEKSALEDLQGTVLRTLVGFVGATVVGIAAGVVMGVNDFGQSFLTPHVFFALTLPGVAWAAVLTVVLGFGFLTPVLVVTVTAWPFITLIVWKGVEDIDRDLIRMSEAFDVPRRPLLFRIILPNVTPTLFSAIRYGIVISWSIEINAEIFATNVGIGSEIVQAYGSFNYVEAFAWGISFLFIIILIEFGILRPIERRAYAYRRDVDFGVVNQ